MKPIEIFNHGIREAVLDQNRFRTSWVKEDTPAHVESLYWEEHQEYLQAKELCMIGADPEAFVSEAGDKGYLYIRLDEITKGRVPRKIQYDILATYHDCNELGVDFMQAVFYKVLRNDIKYPLMLARNGYGYELSRSLSKDQYRMMGGDQAFLYAYMMLADSLHHSE